MFADQTVELLPARTTMSTSQTANGGTAVAVNALNFGLLQGNFAAAQANGGTNVIKTYNFFGLW